MPKQVPVKSRLMFLNTGVITPKNAYRRRWEANRHYGFVSAGQNKESSKAIRGLFEDDIVCAYISKYGFVGIGEVTKEALSIEEFFRTNPLQGRENITEELFANAGNELQEYFVKIKWTHWPIKETTRSIIRKTKTEILACSVKGRGFHIHRGVCCELRKDNSKQKTLVEFIEKGFDVEFQWQ